MHYPVVAAMALTSLAVLFLTTCSSMTTNPSNGYIAEEYLYLPGSKLEKGTLPGTYRCSFKGLVHDCTMDSQRVRLQNGMLRHPVFLRS